ncbi:M14 family metallopeptidase [Microbaculum marinum]|uniref:M14 family metallopeptidase n=1 Tax=Microbaculum marinum TaxID=1764581 RepID=A0AAW9RAV1_9HYPH
MTDPFSDSYGEARGRFIAAASRAGGSVKSYVNPKAHGPRGGSLCMETAVFGPPDAEKALLILSGTHGQEGYTGSAGQLAFMGSQAFADRDPSIRILLIHALNPYGFAYDTRVNENNVDLNRNFVDFSAALPRNEGYAEIHSLICPDEWTEECRSETIFRDRINGDRFTEWMNAINAGQYQEPTGFGFGGTQREWSNETLEAILAAELSGIRKLGFIDWHTGLGGYGEPFFLCFNEQGGPDWERACQWWGRERVDTQSGFDGAPRPQYSGLVFQGVQKFVAPAEMTGAVIEFGTGPILEIFDWHRRDRWLRFGTGPDDAEMRTRFRKGVRDALFPTDPEWRRSVLTHAETIQAQALAGVAAW